MAKVYEALKQVERERSEALGRRDSLLADRIDASLARLNALEDRIDITSREAARLIPEARQQLLDAVEAKLQTLRQDLQVVRSTTTELSHAVARLGRRSSILLGLVAALLLAALFRL